MTDFPKLAWLSAVRRKTQIPIARRMVIEHIGDTADRYGLKAWRSTETVCAELGVSEATVKRARGDAAKYQFWVVTRKAKPGPGNAAEYRLLPPALDAAPAETDDEPDIDRVTSDPNYPPCPDIDRVTSDPISEINGGTDAPISEIDRVTSAPRSGHQCTEIGSPVTTPSGISSGLASGKAKTPPTPQPETANVYDGDGQNPIADDIPSDEPPHDIEETGPDPEDERHVAEADRYEPHPGDNLPARRTNGAELARQRFAAIPAGSVDACRIAESFSCWLPEPIERKELAKIATEIDSCLKSNISPNAIAEGLKLWQASDSWAPTQIPAFVRKANKRPQPTVGKPTEKANGIGDAGAELLAEMEASR